MMKVLIVGMPESIHLARWTSQARSDTSTLALFPVYPASPHGELEQITIFGSLLYRPRELAATVKYVIWFAPFFYFDWIIERAHKKPF